MSVKLEYIQKMEKLEHEQFVEIEENIVHVKIGINAVDREGNLLMAELINRNKMEWNMDVPFVIEKNIYKADGLMVFKEITRLDKINTTLILLPKFLNEKWEKILKNYPNLKFNFYNNNFSPEDELDIILINHKEFNTFIKIYKFAWKRFIFIEPFNFKGVDLNNFTSNFYWFVTNNPNSIKIRFDSRRGFINKIFCNSEDDVNTQFEKVIIRDDKTELDLNSINIINHNVRLFKRELKSFEILNLLSICAEEELMSLMGVEKEKIIDAVLDYKKYESKENLTSENIEKVKLSIGEKLNNLENLDCNICLEKLISKSLILEMSCQNIFCGKCFASWIDVKNTCPCCRKEIINCQLVYLIGTTHCIVDKSTKWRKTIEFIKLNNNKKILIYACVEDLNRVLLKYLKEFKINFECLKDNDSFKKTLTSYVEGSLNVLIIEELRCLDLEVTDDLIFYSNCSNSDKKQIINMVNNMSLRINKLNVHYFNEI